MSKLLKAVKRIAVEAALEAGLEVCRGYVLERLEQVTPDDLYLAIKNGTHTMGAAEEKDRKFGRKWAKKFKKTMFKGKKLRSYLTPKLVLNWLCEDRSDLASLVINMNPEGMKWLQEDVKKIYSFLWKD